MTLSLPPHQKKRFKEILAERPNIQKCIGVYKWHQVLGQICSIYIALPGAQGLFIHMQDSLHNVEGKRVALTRGVHQALADFQWLAEELCKFPTRLYELIPLHIMMDVYHNTSGYMCEKGVLPGTTEVPQTPQHQPRAASTSPEPAGAHPIL